MHPKFSPLVLPFTRRQIPLWSRLMHLASSDWEDRLRTDWKDSAQVVMRGTQHGLLMNLDRSDWAQRMTFFLGRYYELGVVRVFDALLRPGDAFIDIGTNIGMLTLHARSLVGDTGRIDCFEPNPDCVKAINSNLSLNGIRNVHVHACALSDIAGKLKLNITSSHSGTGTLANVEDAIETVEVDVHVGDEMSLGLPKLIKIDVEGFELKVLRGLRQTIQAAKPFIVIELIETQLQRAGTSVSETSAFLFERGYQAFGIRTERRLGSYRLILTPIPPGRSFENCSDVVWAHQERMAELPLKQIRSH